MAAGLGFKTFTTGEVLTAADTNGYLMQGINVFASTAARDAAITSPQEGQFAFTKDTNGLWYYDGAAWVASGATGDIEGVTAGIGISGGGTSGTVTVTNSMATAIDAKGDLIAGTAADTFSRLAVGANDTVLTADSTQATGLKWAAAASSGSSNVAGKNGVINSNFSVAQRGTSISLAASAGTTYTLDRWCTQTGANQACTVSQVATGDTTNLPFIEYALRYKRNTSQTGTGALTLLNAFETINSRPFAGKSVALSFYARAGANYSASASALAVRLDSGTGTNQNPFAGYTGAATVASTTATLTTTWQRFSATGTVSATATELNVQVVFTPTGTAGANDYYEITGVQVEIASSASAYSPCTATYATELAACQRYFQRAIYAAVNSSERLTTGNATGAGSSENTYRLVCTMRTSPTFSVSAASDFIMINSGGGSAGTPAAISGAIFSPNMVRVDTSGGSGLTAGNATVIQATGGSSTMDFSAEL